MFPKTFESYWSRIYWHHSPHHTTISPPWFVVDSPRDRFVFPLIGQVQPRVFQLEIYWNSSDKTMRYHQHHQHNNHNLSLIIGILSTEKLTASLFFYWLTSRLLSLYVYCWDWFLRFPHTMNHRGECNLAGRWRQDYQVIPFTPLLISYWCNSLHCSNKDYSRETESGSHQQ